VYDQNPNKSKVKKLLQSKKQSPDLSSNRSKSLIMCQTNDKNINQSRRMSPKLENEKPRKSKENRQ
jgi:ribosomal protein L18